MTTVFDNIVTKENDHTHLLRSLMERHSAVAVAVLSHLFQLQVSEVEAANLSFRAQSSYLSELGREIPDLVIEGPGFHCLIEVKVDPSLELTAAQRNGYVSCFPKTTNGDHYLCFLVPNEWKHIAWGERVRNALPVSIKSNVSYWRQLIQVLENASASISDQILSEAIRFWKWRFEVEPMTNEERQVLTSWCENMYGAISKLEKAVSQAKALFEAREWQTELETDTSTFGFYLKRGSSYVLWVGIWTKAPVPLCFGVHSKKAGWVRPRDFPFAPARTSDLIWHLWPLESAAWDDAEKIYDSVTAFINAQYDATIANPSDHPASHAME
jgi:hypothetical protein